MALDGPSNRAEGVADPRGRETVELGDFPTVDRS
jgi:hypothetical protein